MLVRAGRVLPFRDRVCAVVRASAESDFDKQSTEDTSHAIGPGCKAFFQLVDGIRLRPLPPGSRTIGSSTVKPYCVRFSLGPIAYAAAAPPMRPPRWPACVRARRHANRGGEDARLHQRTERAADVDAAARKKSRFV